MPIKILLGNFPLIAGNPNPVEGPAYLGFAPLVKTEEKAALLHGGFKCAVDMQGVGREFVGILAGDAPATEEILIAFPDKGKGFRMEIGPEGQELHLRVAVELAQHGHGFLADGFILIEEHGDFPLLHGLLFPGEKPRHAVDENCAFRMPAYFRQGVEEAGIAETEHGVAGLDGRPVRWGVHNDAQGNHLVVKRLPVVIPGRDDMDFHAHLAPDNDLVVKFRSRSSVEAREPVDE